MLYSVIYIQTPAAYIFCFNFTTTKTMKFLFSFKIKHNTPCFGFNVNLASPRWLYVAHAAKLLVKLQCVL